MYNRRLFGPYLKFYIDFRKFGSPTSIERSALGAELEVHSGVLEQSGMVFARAGDGVEIKKTSQDMIGDDSCCTVIIVAKMVDEVAVQCFIGSYPAVEDQFWLVSNTGIIEFAYDDHFTQLVVGGEMVGVFKMIMYNVGWKWWHAFLGNGPKTGGVWASGRDLDGTLNIHIGAQNKDTGIQDRLAGTVQSILIYSRKLAMVEIHRIRHIMTRKI